ncbi:MAG: hypothetical protein GYB68_18515, partial [Chloroflexi bacterium]|nr:hypothetical protein [Chloroflexota bacterium]
VDVGADTPDPDLTALVRGDVDSIVQITVRRDDQLLTFDVQRAEVLVPSTFWQIAHDDPAIGLIQITRFTDRAPAETQQAIRELREQGAVAFIIDIRNNGGGLVDSAVAIAGEFLAGGVVLFEERQGTPNEERKTASLGGAALNDPVVVLVNGGTASASEILAGALQDRGRGLLVGEPTFGKGSVQVILPLSDGSSLHVTNAEWFTPNYNRIEGQGLTPDVIVTPIEGQDSALLRAIELLSEQIRVVDTDQ